MKAIFQSVQHLYEKREGSGAGSGPLTNRPDPESPKTWGSGSRSGSPTLVDTYRYLYAAAGTRGGSEEVLLQHGVCWRTNVTRPALGWPDGFTCNTWWLKPVLRIRIRINFGRLDPDPHWEYGSGSRKAKITHRKKVKKIQVLKC